VFVWTRNLDPVHLSRVGWLFADIQFLCHVGCFEIIHGQMDVYAMFLYRVFSSQADWTLIHTSHKDTEQSTIEDSIILGGVTLTDPLIRWSPNE
jgi:hypothetical protein